MDTASVAIHDLEAVEKRDTAVREVASPWDRPGPRCTNGGQPARPLASGEQSGPVFRAPHRLLRLVSLACSTLTHNPLNRRTRTRIYGGVAGADGRPSPLCRLIFRRWRLLVRPACPEHQEGSLEGPAAEQTERVVRSGEFISPSRFNPYSARFRKRSLLSRGRVFQAAASTPRPCST
jgi:hypothetical protein